MKYLLLVFIMSCASADTEWKPETVSQNKEFWGWCNQEIDPKEYHDKGWCWSYQECRINTKFLRKDKKECRVKWKFCPAGDIACIKDNKLDEKILVGPDDIF